MPSAAPCGCWTLKYASKYLFKYLPAIDTPHSPILDNLDREHFAPFEPIYCTSMMWHAWYRSVCIGFVFNYGSLCWSRCGANETKNQFRTCCTRVCSENRPFLPRDLSTQKSSVAALSLSLFGQLLRAFREKSPLTPVSTTCVSGWVVGLCAMRRSTDEHTSRVWHWNYAIARETLPSGRAPRSLCVRLVCHRCWCRTDGSTVQPILACVLYSVLHSGIGV